MSPKYRLNKQDLEKIGKGLVIAMLGAGFTYLETTISSMSFGEWTPVVVAVNSVVVNIVRKFLAGA